MRLDHTQIFDDRFNENDEILLDYVINCKLRDKHKENSDIRREIGFRSSLNAVETLIFDRIKDIHPGAII